MSLWSSLNGNLGKAPEQAAAVDMDKNRIKGPGNDLLVDPTDLGKTSKKPVVLSAIAVSIVLFLTFNIIMKMTAEDTSDAFAVTAMYNGEAIELYENSMKVSAHEDGEWIFRDAPSVVENLAEIATQVPMIMWDESFELVVPEEAKLKWFDLYDETFECVRRYAEVKEVSEFLAGAEPATYYIVVGASWEGKYVLKSFTNESFSSEFVVAVMKGGSVINARRLYEIIIRNG